MGQVASLIRINESSFTETKKTKKYPKLSEEVIYVDKLWEPIMYVLGEGFLGKSPIVNLFMPKNIIVTYKDQYMTDGIRYHGKTDMEELYNFIDKKSIDNLMLETDIKRMNTKVMYPINAADLELIKKHIVQIKECLFKAINYEQVIIASIE